MGTITSFETELAILAKLEHGHIVKMHESFVEEGALHIVLELCRGGDLFEYIIRTTKKDNRNGLDEAVARHLFDQMLYAINYLHSKRIVHRDIKTENFLLINFDDGAPTFTIKLCDFGTAIQLSDKSPRSMDKIGTLSYTAPEVYANLGASVRADDWSLGVVLYVLLVGASPFRTTAQGTSQETMDRICRGDFEKSRRSWREATSNARDLVQRFLVVKERERLTSAVALRHQWVVEKQRTNIAEDQNLSSCAPAAYETLRRFQRLGKMQRLFLAICARVAPEVDLVDDVHNIPWYKLFHALDRNLDGRLDHCEFVHGMKALLGSSVDSTSWKLLVRTWIPRGLVPLVGRVGLLLLHCHFTILLTRRSPSARSSGCLLVTVWERGKSYRRSELKGPRICWTHQR